MEWNRLGAAICGGIFVLIGGRLIQTISGAGGDLIPPILALGGLLLLFGVSLVVASVQTRVALRQLLEYELVAGSIGLFGISVYVMLLTLGSTGPLARFFSLLGGIGAVLNATLLLLVKRHQQ